MVCDCWKTPEDSVSHGLCKQDWEECHTNLQKYTCKQKRRGMIYLWEEITSFMGAALESLVDKGIVFSLLRFVDNDIHSSNIYFILSI